MASLEVIGRPAPPVIQYSPRGSPRRDRRLAATKTAAQPKIHHKQLLAAQDIAAMDACIRHCRLQ
jgi:hypothetical protein